MRTLGYAHVVCTFQIWARPLGSQSIRYIRDGRTDEQADGQTQRLLPLPYWRGHNKPHFVFRISNRAERTPIL